MKVLLDECIPRKAQKIHSLVMIAKPLLKRASPARRTALLSLAESTAAPTARLTGPAQSEQTVLVRCALVRLTDQMHGRIYVLRRVERKQNASCLHGVDDESILGGVASLTGRV